MSGMAPEMANQRILTRYAAFGTIPGIITTFDRARNLGLKMDSSDVALDILLLISASFAILEGASKDERMAGQMFTSISVRPGIV